MIKAIEPNSRVICYFFLLMRALSQNNMKLSVKKFSEGTLSIYYVTMLLKLCELVEYSLMSFEKNEFSLPSSLAGVSYSAIFPVHE